MGELPSVHHEFRLVILQNGFRRDAVKTDYEILARSHECASHAEDVTNETKSQSYEGSQIESER